MKPLGDLARLLRCRGPARSGGGALRGLGSAASPGGRSLHGTAAGAAGCSLLGGGAGSSGTRRSLARRGLLGGRPGRSLLGCRLLGSGLLSSCLPGSGLLRCRFRGGPGRRFGGGLLCGRLLRSRLLGRGLLGGALLHGRPRGRLRCGLRSGFLGGEDFELFFAVDERRALLFFAVFLVLVAPVSPVNNIVSGFLVSVGIAASFKGLRVQPSRFKATSLYQAGSEYRKV